MNFQAASLTSRVREHHQRVGHAVGRLGACLRGAAGSGSCRFGASSLICGISIGKVKIVADLALLEQVEHVLAVVVGRRRLGQPLVDHLLVERGGLDRRPRCSARSCRPRSGCSPPWVQSE